MADSVTDQAEWSGSGHTSREDAGIDPRKEVTLMIMRRSKNRVPQGGLSDYKEVQKRSTWNG